MNFVGLKMLIGFRGLRSGECARARARLRNPGIRRILISVLTFLGMSAFLVAGPVIDARAQTTGSPSYYLKRGIERYNAGDYDAAIADFSEAIELNSGFASLRDGKQVRSKFSNNQYRDELDRIVVADPFNAVAYYNRGLAWHVKGEVERAIDDFNKAIGINPRYVDAYIVRGKAWHSKGDIGRAVADYDRAIVLDSRSAFAYNNRGIARKDMKDIAGAMSDFDRAIVLSPGLAQAYINRGAARCTLGDLAGAMADLNHAVTREPRNPMAYNNRGATRQATGDFTGAIEDYNKAILLDPENALAYVNRALALLEH